MSDQKRGKSDSKWYLTFNSIHILCIWFICLVGDNAYFVVVCVSKTDISKNCACCVTELCVINLIYNIIGVTWHHL